MSHNSTIKINVGRYKNPDEVGWIGWAEPSDETFIVFWAPGKFACWARDEDGAIVGEPISSGDVDADALGMLLDAVTKRVLRCAPEDG